MSFCERSLRSQHATKYGGHMLAWDITTVLFLQLFKEICLKIQDGEFFLQSFTYRFSDGGTLLYLTCIIMAALWNRAGHYIFAPSIYLLFSISVVGD